MRRLRDASEVLGTALLTGALLVYAVLTLRETTLRSGEELTDSLSLVIAEQTARTLQSGDQALRLAAARLDVLRRAGTPDAAAGAAILQEESRHAPFIRDMWVTDAQGRVLVASRPEQLGRIVGGMPPADAGSAAPAPGLHIGNVQRDASGQWRMLLARAVREGGSVREVLVAAVDPRHFEQLWRGIDLGATGAVVLYRRDGRLLVRSPADEQLMGKDFSHLALFREYLPRAPEGTFTRESSLDGVRRVVAYRQLPGIPDLLVAVGTGFDELLAPWRRFAMLTAAVWAAAVIAALVLVMQLQRHSRHSDDTQQRFWQLAQAVPQIVFTCDRQGQLEFVSQRWTEVTGYPPQSALGSGWRHAVHPDDLAMLMQRQAEALRDGAELQLEFRLRQADGSYRWQLLRALPVNVADAGVPSRFGTVTDIDTLKKAQATLARQAEQLGIASRLTRMGNWRADLVAQRMVLSEEVCAVLDLPPDAEPTLQELFAMMDPRSMPAATEVMKRCVEHRESFDVELEMITATGRRVWVRSVGEPIQDEAGRVVAVQGAQQDITLRMLMMEEIRRLNANLEERIAERTAQLSRQEALFRTLAEQAPLPFWTVDPDGAVTFLSRAWYELAGGAAPEWQGMEWMRLVHPDDRPQMIAQWEHSRRTGEPFAGTRRIRARDGTYHTTTYRALPVRDEQGQILFWVGVDADITEISDNADALRLANKQLEAFSYSVSHDLQSPLQRVGSYARLLQQELPASTDGKAQHYLERILANADTMTQLIEGLLALAHVSELDIIRATVNLSEMATEILSRLQAEQPHRRVHWMVEPGLAVTADARLMRSVLENLVGNAWKFTSGKDDAAIEVGGSAERGDYFVRDTGAGFDMAYADRLFGTFQRLHGEDEFPGTGIGLATVARAISRQGGRVWARSVPGEGATFFFTLPAA